MAEIVYRDRETIVSNTLYTDGQIETVTVSELVRCKYCKYCQYDSIFGSYWCSGRLGGIEIEADFFCKDGERKDDDENG